MRFCEVDRAEQAWRFYTNEKEDNRNQQPNALIYM